MIIMWNIATCDVPSVCCSYKPSPALRLAGDTWTVTVVILDGHASTNTWKASRVR